jgi:murein DD-endopeptidase MepM/ murein hydrolase activator NlpD
MLADASQIKPTLLISGISESEANSATSQVVSLLGTGDGELRLAFTLTGTGKNTALAKLEATRTNGSGVLLTRTSGGAFSPQPLAPQLTVRTYAKRGELDDTSFYTSAVAAGITDSLISDFANAFSFDFDFQREVKPGAVFEGVFEQAANPAGAAVGEPRLIYVSLSTPGKARRFYRFTPPGEKEPGWFDDNGRSTVRSLMRTPLDGARVTSKFGLRIHPIYGSAKMHGGIDFGAPTGTPIYASGNGVVEVASMRGGAGNMVRVNHDNGWSTHYFHLHRFAPGLLVGQRVAQGQTIGEVGSTGASTGPHLHYELLVEGKKVDPLSVDTGTGVTLQGATLATFRKERDRIDLTRAQQSE